MPSRQVDGMHIHSFLCGLRGRHNTMPDLVPPIKCQGIKTKLVPAIHAIVENYR